MGKNGSDLPDLGKNGSFKKMLTCSIMPFLNWGFEHLLAVRVGEDDGELPSWQYIYVYSIESRLAV